MKIEILKPQTSVFFFFFWDTKLQIENPILEPCFGKLIDCGFVRIDNTNCRGARRIENGSMKTHRKDKLRIQTPLLSSLEALN